jgi:ABC-type transport system involved in cytochrome c biogenesis ATPase subunit
MWASVTTFGPELLIGALASNNLLALVAAILLASTPLLRLANIYFAQSFAESFFAEKRLEFFSSAGKTKYNESYLFTQAAFLIKNGIKFLAVEAPIALFLIAAVIVFSSYKSPEYRIAILGACCWGVLSIFFSIYVNNKYPIEIDKADAPTLRMYKEFSNSRATYSGGIWGSEFKRAFEARSRKSRQAYMKYTLVSLAPGVVAELGLVLIFLFSGALYYFSGKQYVDLVPLFFQVTAITSVFVGISSELPAGKLVLQLILKNNQTRFDDASAQIRELNTNSYGLSFKFHESELKLSVGTCYRLSGPNGVGKTFFLTRLASECIRHNVGTIYLGPSTDLQSLTGATSASDGERQLANLTACVRYGASVYIFDEAFNSVDSQRLQEIKVLLGGLCSDGAIILLVDHADTWPDARSIVISSRSLVLVDRPT